jgi:hypothetical protein
VNRVAEIFFGEPLSPRTRSHVSKSPRQSLFFGMGHSAHAARVHEDIIYFTRRVDPPLLESPPPDCIMHVRVAGEGGADMIDCPLTYSADVWSRGNDA